jgi:hypothetical protein
MVKSLFVKQKYKLESIDLGAITKAGNVIDWVQKDGEVFRMPALG